LASLSRLSTQLLDKAQLEKANKLRSLLAKYQEIEFLVQVGEYKEGSDPLADAAIAQRHAINSFLQQSVSERTTASVAWDQLLQAVNED
jgi:type III secretion protein N (ATPase)